MSQFKVLPAPKEYEFEIEKFLGIDTQTDPTDVSPNRSPDCRNVIRDYVGSIRKRYGYKTMDTFAGRINGVHILKTDTDKRLIHAGGKYYHNAGGAYIEAGTGKDDFSVSQQLNGKLYIVDGEGYAEYDGEAVKAPDGKVPVIIIDRNPAGGGTPLEQVNLIQPGRIEKFKGDGTAKDFQLTATSLDAAAVTARQLQADGTLKDLAEGADFTVNRALGKVTFGTAPPVTPSAGEDNIFITYAKTVEGYADRINGCTVSVVYGMHGAFDRLILAGNPKYRNYDWFSKANDFTYFGDLDYNTAGQDNAAIVNYAVDNGLLITLKDTSDNEVNSLVRKFELIDGRVVLRAVGSIQTRGALSGHSFAYLENEPMYMTTGNTVAAITTADSRTERFSQGRSYYIDKTLAALDLRESYAVSYNGFYIFTAGNSLYLLDGLQPSYQKNTPYSHRQYECFKFTDIGARVLWVEDGELWFGTSDGRIKKFAEGVYNDDGVPVTAVWETPVIFTPHWNFLKTFRHLCILLKSSMRTGVRVEAAIAGKMEEVVPYNSYWHYFSFGNVNFSKWTFSTDSSERASSTKINIKKIQQTRLRFTSDKDEPLSIVRIGLTYIALRKIK